MHTQDIVKHKWQVSTSIFPCFKSQGHVGPFHSLSTRIAALERIRWACNSSMRWLSPLLSRSAEKVPHGTEIFFRMRQESHVTARAPSEITLHETTSKNVAILHITHMYVYIYIHIYSYIDRYRSTYKYKQEIWICRYRYIDIDIDTGVYIYRYLCISV